MIGVDKSVNLESKQLPEIILDKEVLFITTKNIDYIRNMQEIRILNELASGVEIISSNKKNYMLRVLSVWNKIKRSKIQQADIIFIGFAPQLIIPFLVGRLKKKIIIVDFFISIYETGRKSFFFIDKTGFISSAIFSMLRLHFLIMFWFCAACLSNVVFASSRKVTSKCQCILSMLQWPFTALLNVSIFAVRLLI